jgi:hypothetical protein
VLTSDTIKNKAMHDRFRAKRNIDLYKINARMNEVELQCNFRVVTVLETVATELGHDVLPKLRDAKARWRLGC